MTSPRVFIAACQHETNSFSPLPTTLDSFRSGLWLRPSRQRSDIERVGEAVGYGAMARAVEARGWKLVRGPAFFAMPSAPCAASTWAELKRAILEDLATAGEVDIALFSLHGAQLAADCLDCEGDLLEAVRAQIGPRPLVGALLDLHGHVSDRMSAHADAMLACLEYPHIDFDERADLLVSIMAAAIDSGARPRTWRARVPMIDMHHTTREPMRGLVAAARSAQGGGAAAISLMHGFPWADCPDAGASVVVIGSDEAVAKAALNKFSRDFFTARGEVRARQLDFEAALKEAARTRAKGPLVIADMADNPGGGAGSDSTYFLHALIERRIPDAAVAIVWDEEAARAAMHAGAGAEIQLTIGGKAGPFSGPPVSGRAEILATSEDIVQGGPFERAGRPAGAALVRIGGVLTAISGRRQQCVDPQTFSQFGVDPSALGVIVVKSMQHFHAGFAPIASRIVYAAGPGSLSFDFASLPFEHLPRPIWPLDEVRFGAP